MGHATHSSREQSGGRDFTRIDFVRLLKAQTRRGQCELRVCECVCEQLCVCVRQVQVQSRVLCKQMKNERESDENQKLRRFDGGCKKIKLATAQSARLSSPFHYATLALSPLLCGTLYPLLYVTPTPSLASYHFRSIHSRMFYNFLSLAWQIVQS